MKARDRMGEYYLLPGGGQRNGETLREAARRECLEETGAEVKPLELRFVRDYIAANHEFAGEDGSFHQVELMFSARFLRLRRGARLVPDSRQTGHEWVPLASLPRIRLYPSALRRRIKKDGTLSGPVYLGDAN